MLGRQGNQKDRDLLLREPIIRAWARDETFPWRRRHVDYGAALDEFLRLNEQVMCAYVYAFKAGEVTLAEKPDALNPEPLKDRSETYLRFFREVIAEMPFEGEIVLALGVGDGPLDSGVAPTFSFQKPIGHPTILLNDVNMIEGDFYEPPPFLDGLSFDRKEHKGVFVGATSGMHNSADSVRARANPRIDAALYFKDKALVDFSLPSIVQCEPEAEALIRAMELGSNFIGWQQQFSYKFLLSLDGNGAACQRIAVALKSNSAVLKYNSNSLLYYFKGLVPWYHFIPIYTHSEVIDIIKESSKADLGIQEIAKNGRVFFEEFLSRRSQSLYFRMLLEEYAYIFRS